MAEKREKPESMNAFALISRSQGFNLGNLFEKEMMVGFDRVQYYNSMLRICYALDRLECFFLEAGIG